MYAKKDRDQILRNALKKLEKETSITAIGPGSVARSIAEVVTAELGDFYEVLDFNTAMGVISTASGRSLELIGRLYNVERKPLGDIAALNEEKGSFYFYIDSPHTEPITIPSGTSVYTDTETYLGRRFSYTTTSDAFIGAGRLRGFATLRPKFNDSVFTAGANTLVNHDFDDSDLPLTVKSTNPKPIAPQRGYESDNQLRERIVKKVREFGGGTYDAVRSAVLRIPGMRDVRVRSSQYGLGTVGVLIVPEDRSELSNLRAQAMFAVNRVAAAGVRAVVTAPDMMPVNVRVHIRIRPGTNVEPSGTARKVEIALRRFLNEHLPGDTMFYTQLIHAIMEASDAVADARIESLRVDGAEIPRRNYSPDSQEQLVPGVVTVNTA